MTDEARTIGIAVCVIVMIVAVIGKLASDSSRPASTRRTIEPPNRDQLDVLTELGVSEDVERLKQQGVDVTALGYRAPD